MFLSLLVSTCSLATLFLSLVRLASFSVTFPHSIRFSLVFETIIFFAHTNSGSVTRAYSPTLLCVGEAIFCSLCLLHAFFPVPAQAG